MPYIQTLSGKHINYTDIQHDDIVIEDNGEKSVVEVAE